MVGFHRWLRSNKVRDSQTPQLIERIALLESEILQHQCGLGNHNLQGWLNWLDYCITPIVWDWNALGNYIRSSNLGYGCGKTVTIQLGMDFLPGGRQEWKKGRINVDRGRTRMGSGEEGGKKGSAEGEQCADHSLAWLSLAPDHFRLFCIHIKIHPWQFLCELLWPVCVLHVHLHACMSLHRKQTLIWTTQKVRGGTQKDPRSEPMAW